MQLRDWLRGSALDTLDAQVIAQHVLGLGRAQLITQGERPLSAAELSALQQAQHLRQGGMPAAYITGRKEFYSLDFSVTPDVLVPRPETELLVDAALGFLRQREDAAPRVLDLGTGSGCVAIAIAVHVPRAEVWAVDASAAAWAVAARNNTVLAQGRVRLLVSDWFSALAAERFDLIVSNPPYIADGDGHLAALRHEPAQALTAGPDGLEAIRRITAQAPAHLRPGGALWLEHGHDQAGAVRALLATAGFTQVSSTRDLAGIARISGGVCGESAAPAQRLQFGQ